MSEQDGEYEAADAFVEEASGVVEAEGAMRPKLGSGVIDADADTTREVPMAERRVASQKCLTGQPVDIPGGSVLRTVLGAAQLKDLISGKQSLESMLEDDKVLLAKLALIARQYD